MAGIHVRFEITPDAFLSHLTMAVYQVALKHGFKVPFNTIELDFLAAIREVIDQDMKVSPACGDSEECRSADRFAPWSKDADKLFKSE